MVANSHVTGDHYAELANQIDQLNRKIDNIGRRTPNSLFVQTGAGEVLVDIGPSGWYDADGNELNSVAIYDPISGFPLLKQIPATIDGSVGTNWYWAMYDASGNQMVATDGLAGAGMSYPFENVKMYPYWNGGYTGTPGLTGYATVVASQIVGSAKLMWEGRLGYVSHPAISVEGTWGDATGSTSTATYTLMVGGTSVGTWTVAPAAFGPAKHIFSIASFVGGLDVPVQLYAQASPTSIELIACHILGVHMRQTPTVFG